MLFYINLFISVIFFIYYIFKSFKNGILVNMHIILWFGYLVIIFINPIITNNTNILNDKYNFLFNCSTLGLLVASILFPIDIFSDYKVKKDERISCKYIIKEHYALFFSIIYIVYLIFGIIVQIINAGSIVGALTYNRLAGYLGKGYLSGESIVNLFMPFFQFPYYVYCICKFRNHKYISFAIFISIPIINHIFTANTRFDLIVMIVSAWVFIYQEKLVKILKDNTIAIRVYLNELLNKSKIKLSLLIPRIMIIVIAVFLVMNYGNQIRSGTFLKNTTNSGSFNASSIKQRISQDLNYYNFTYKLFNSIDQKELSYEEGKGWAYYPIISLIPRRLWSEKPITSTSSRLTELLYWKLGTGNPVVTFTIFGEGYLQFGYLGAFFAPILFLLLYYLLIRLANKFLNSELYIYQIVLGMFTWLRGELPVTITLVKIIFMIIMIFFSYKICISQNIVNTKNSEIV